MSASPTIRQHKSLRNLIEAIPEEDGRRFPTGWTAPPRAETAYTPFQSEPGAAPVRLIVRRVKPAPGSQLALFASYSYHGFITAGTERPWNWRPMATPRSRTRYASTASG